MRSRWLILLTVLASALGPGTADSQMKVEVAPFAGGAFFLSDLTEGFGESGDLVQSHDTGFAPGAHVGLRWDRWSVEGSFAYVPTEIVLTAPDFESRNDQGIVLSGISGVYNGELNPFMELFAAAGVGAKTYTKDDPFDPPGFEAGTDFSFHFGGGLRYFISETTAVRLDARDHVSSFDAFELFPESGEEAKIQHDLLLTVGLSFNMGG